ncbi:hypothetical protein IG631_05191 [Alternaria alternata]|nr:hypothetical protein IG631_05191 [Alternaria alternata]
MQRPCTNFRLIPQYKGVAKPPSCSVLLRLTRSIGRTRHDGRLSPCAGHWAGAKTGEVRRCVRTLFGAVRGITVGLRGCTSDAGVFRRALRLQFERARPRLTRFGCRCF